VVLAPLGAVLLAVWVVALLVVCEAACVTPPCPPAGPVAEPACCAALFAWSVAFVLTADSPPDAWAACVVAFAVDWVTACVTSVPCAVCDDPPVWEVVFALPEPESDPEGTTGVGGAVCGGPPAARSTMDPASPDPPDWPPCETSPARPIGAPYAVLPKATKVLAAIAAKVAARRRPRGTSRPAPWPGRPRFPTTSDADAETPTGATRC
jgi:hypothetical protein